MGSGSGLFKASKPDSGFKRPLLVSYYPLGDPLISLDLLDVYCDGGVDGLEIGMASANPYLDGATVRQSMARARAAAPRPALDRLLDRLSRRGRAPGILLMTYADADHPALGSPQFWDGIDGLMAVAPPQEPIRLSLEHEAAARGVAVSTFVTRPAAPADHAAALSADGYVMLQAADGLTGPRASLDPGNRRIIADLRDSGVAAPILLGFGISDGWQAAQALSLGADGIVVGSRCLAAALEGPLALRAALDDLRQGLDGAQR